MSIMRYDSRALGRLMTARHLSVRSLAAQAHVERGTIKLLRARVTAPNARTLAKLATALGVDANAFFINGGRV